MAETEERQLLQLPTAEIRPNPYQPRRCFDEEGLRELASSIALHGVLQPLTVRRSEFGWELIAGERRLRAARMAGREVVPCVEMTADDEASALLALVENLQRRDLHFFEEAEAVAAYIRKTGCTQEVAAVRLGRSPSALANKLRILRLSDACRTQVVAESLSERHARALLRLEDEEERLAALRQICARKLNVAQTEQYIDRQLELLQTTPPAGRRTFIMKDVRLFLNSVERGLRLMREAGVEACTERQDTEEEIRLTVRIPRKKKI